MTGVHTCALPICPDAVGSGHSGGGGAGYFGGGSGAFLYTYNGGGGGGGSSPCAAGAGADRMVPLAIGTQTGGSMIRPASYCGVFGYKPTYGSIPRRGVSMLARPLDPIGLIR